MSDEPQDDITVRLSLAALDSESVEHGDMEALLREAIKTIELLRVLVGIREEVEAEELAEIGLEDIEPEGNA